MKRERFAADSCSNPRVRTYRRPYEQREGGEGGVFRLEEEEEEEKEEEEEEEEEDDGSDPMDGIARLHS